MVEASFGVPMAGAVLNALNIRLDLASLTFMLRHGQAKVLLADTEFAELARQMAAQIPGLRVIQVNDVLGPQVEPFAELDYESLLASGDPDYAWQPPADEWDAIALNYTSGTTGDPKGVVYHHRGAALNALSNILEWDMPKHAVYLWTLPMFHCNGWCFPWTIAARAGVNVCLRKFEPKLVFDLMRELRVTHYCAAPIVHAGLANAPAGWREGIDWTVRGMVAGAPPPAAMVARIEAMGFDLIHSYGLTEVYGPAAICAEQEEWAALSPEERAVMKSRQGVRYHLQSEVAVLDPETMQPVAPDGEQIGEIMFRGNICMKGYLKNEKATQEAFAGGWFHTGDLGVRYPDGYIKLKDRSKDIIISGGENISSVEVEDALVPPPAGAGRRRDRPARRKMGRDAVRVRRTARRRQRDGSRTDRLLQEQPGRLQGAESDLLRPPAPHLDRQDPEIRTAQAHAVRQGDRRLSLASGLGGRLRHHQP